MYHLNDLCTFDNILGLLMCSNLTTYLFSELSYGVLCYNIIL